MWLILFWFVGALGVIVERSLYLFGSSQQPDVFAATVIKMLEAKNYTGSIDLAERSRSPLGRIVKAGLKQALQSPEKIQEAMDIAALRELPKISRRVNLLALFANLAMLCGLFGTIVGLIKAFASVAGDTVDPTAKARLLAEGISEAMNCTAFGLLSAIVALTGYALLNGWIQSIEDDIHAQTVRVYNTILRQRKS